MSKNEFLNLLEKRLNGIPKNDIDKTLEYYNEIISDKMEDGLSEEDAVNSLGSVDEIVNNTLADVSIPKLVKEKIGLNRKLKTWEIILLASTFYIWVPLLIAILATILVVYICLWSGVISLGAGALSCGVSGIIALIGIVDIFTGNLGSGIVLVGMGLMLTGAAILLGVLTILLSKVMVNVCKKLVLKIKSLIVKRGETNEV